MNIKLSIVFALLIYLFKIYLTATSVHQIMYRKSRMTVFSE
jgi:hypothetical protein